MDVETNQQVNDEYQSLLELLKTRKNIIRKFDIDNYSEFLIEKRIKKDTQEMKAFHLKRQKMNNDCN